MRRLLFLFLALAMPLAGETRLPTGATLDPVSPSHPLGSFPLAAVLAPGGKQLVVLVSGWRQQGVQVVDRASGSVTQTIELPSTFIGLTFAPDGKTLYASGGNEDLVHVFAWRDGVLADDGTIALGPHPAEKKSGVLYPAGLAVSRDGKRLYVAENLGDSLAVIDLAARKLAFRVKCGRYPYAVVVLNGDVYVSSWGEDGIDVFSGDRLEKRTRIAAGRHPSAMVRNGKRLYVASATTDTIRIIESRKVVKTLTDAPPAGPSEGSTPNALALSRDGKRLFVAEADNNAVAVFDTARGKLLGRIPVEWYPSALVLDGDDLLVVNAKGKGTSPDPSRAQPNQRFDRTTTQYTLGQINGSLLTVNANTSVADLRVFSNRVARANGWDRSPGERKFPHFRHVVYVIKENRTYDQVLGDMPEGDGDKSLVFFDESVSPNHHALARRFGLYDRFFTNAEVSADGHNWSTAAYASDYLEKTVPSQYSGRGRTYDYEGTNRAKPVSDEDDVAAPSAGYLWDLAMKKGISLRNYGEFVYGGDEILPGRPRQAMKSALRKTSNLDYAGFDLSVKDQARMDVWLREFRQYVAHGTMPALEIVRLPNDHTWGTQPDKPTPRAYMADNDLALGRMVEAISTSKYWSDTIIFVLEDDAQNGPDHVDSHRSMLLTISAWNGSGVNHRFVNTTDVIATMEQILGLGSMSQFDHYGRPLQSVFADKPDLTPYQAIVPSISLDEKNPPSATPQQHSELDFSRADAIDDDTFNRILWKALKGDVPYPGTHRAPMGR